MQALKLALPLFLLLAGCSRVPSICDSFDPQELKERHDSMIMRSAPVVVVGVVKSVETVARGLPARKQASTLLDLMKVDILIEDTLQGEINARDVWFFFFGFSSINRGGYSGPPRYRVNPGDRRILFLTRDSGVLRAVGDVLDYSLHVNSGSHKQSDILVQGNLGESIANVLLTLGEHYVPHDLARSISEASPVSDQWSSRPNSIRLLERLTSNEIDIEVASAACFALTDHYYGHYGCLAGVRDETRLPPETRQRAAQMLADQKRLNLEMKAILQTHPLLAFRKAINVDSLYITQQELESLLVDPDPSMRRTACSVLSKTFGMHVAECGTEN